VFKEEEFIQLSSLQHFIFCQRQCALIHIEQMWVENIFTAEGRVMHTNVHKGNIKNIKNSRIETGVMLHSFGVGLVGKADVVEFYKRVGESYWIPFPVEYKRGKPKQNNCDKVQLCAQALCLEEMLKIKVERGALFYGRTRRRLDVVFDNVLRNETKEIIRQVRIFIEKGKTPAPVYTSKCKTCSFYEECLPKLISRKVSVKRFLKEEIEGIINQ